MFKDQYQAVLDRYEEFWERKNTDRPILRFTAAKHGAAGYPAPESLQQQWLDEDYILNRFRAERDSRAYVAEGIPMLFTNLGPGCIAACIGGNYGLAPNTIWFDRQPIIEDWEALPPIEFDENSEMWQHVLRLQNKFMTDPDVHFSITDLGGVMDILASLRATDELLYDLYDYPEEIKELSARVTKIWLKAYEQQVETIRKTGQPFNTWMNIPSSKPWYPMQSDFSYMISPKHFEEFVLPDLVEQAKHIERPVYHLDGVGELPHLDMILDIPGLVGIQWAPGAGEAPEWDAKWFDVIRKIQDKKKNVILIRGISENDVEGAERFYKTVDPTGVFVAGNFSSEEKANEMLENINRWCK